MMDFQKDLQFSFGERQRFDCNALLKHFPGAVLVEKAPVEMDRKGIDYIVHLKGGAEIFIDAKARRKLKEKDIINGDPCLALEMWSVVPDEQHSGKPGWTWSDETNVDYILYTFEKTDYPYYFLFPFQQLRKAFYKNSKEWVKVYGTRIQPNKAYNSEAIFVPSQVVKQAVIDTMQIKEEQ